jgi:6-phosphogluconolactonase
MPSGLVAPLSTSTGPATGEEFIFKYHDSEIDVHSSIFTNQKAGAVGLAKLVSGVAAEAIAKKGHFSLALSGGSLVNQITGLLQHEGADKPDFSKWHIFYADERVVSHSDPESNHGQMRRSFLSKAGIPDTQVHAIQENLSPELAARAYEGVLLNLPKTVCPKNPRGVPQMDLILLGIGPDGHTASLFPNRPQTAEKNKFVVEVLDSPKPPSERITMTFPLINAAANVFIVAMGIAKAEVVQRVMEVQSLPGALPAQLVRPHPGHLRWVLDFESASEINPELWDSERAHPRSEIPKKAKA